MPRRRTRRGIGVKKRVFVYFPLDGPRGVCYDGITSFAGLFFCAHFFGHSLQLSGRLNKPLNGGAEDKCE